MGCEKAVSSDVLRCDSPGCNLVVSPSFRPSAIQQLRVPHSITLHVAGLFDVLLVTGFAMMNARRMPEVEWVANGGVACEGRLQTHKGPSIYGISFLIYPRGEGGGDLVALKRGIHHCVAEFCP